MSEELYVSMEHCMISRISRVRPYWNLALYSYHGGHFICSHDMGEENFDFIFPQLRIKPGQLALVNREVKDGVVTLTLGEIIESH